MEGIQTITDMEDLTFLTTIEEEICEQSEPAVITITIECGKYLIEIEIDI